MDLSLRVINKFFTKLTAAIYQRKEEKKIEVKINQLVNYQETHTSREKKKLTDHRIERQIVVQVHMNEYINIEAIQCVSSHISLFMNGTKTEEHF